MNVVEAITEEMVTALSQYGCVEVLNFLNRIVYN